MRVAPPGPLVPARRLLALGSSRSSRSAPPVHDTVMVSERARHAQMRCAEGPTMAQHASSGIGMAGATTVHAAARRAALSEAAMLAETEIAAAVAAAAEISSLRLRRFKRIGHEQKGEAAQAGLQEAESEAATDANGLRRA